MFWLKDEATILFSVRSKLIGSLCDEWTKYNSYCNYLVVVGTIEKIYN